MRRILKGVSVMHTTRVVLDNETFHIRPEVSEIIRVNRQTLEHKVIEYPTPHLFNEAAAVIIDSGEVL
jgi:hypothetical protein